MLNKDEFNLPKFFDINGKIRNVFIASGYCDIDSISEVYKIISKNFDQRGANFKIFIDRNANNALPNQNKYSEFYKIDKKIRNISSNSGIFLVQHGNLFHSKILYIESTKETKIYIGSMNLTQKAINIPGNEEILLELNNNTIIRQVNRYFDELENISENFSVLSKQKISYNSFRSFLLQGNLYLPYTKSEFFNFKIGIPEYTKQYSVNIPLPANINDTINVLYEIAPEIKERKNNFSWKIYTIETPYGYWAPCEFENNISKIINGKQSNKDNSIIKVKSLLVNKNKVDKIIINKFFIVDKWLKKSFPSGNLEDWSVDNVITRWNRWYNNLLEKLDINDENNMNNEKLQIQRYITGVHITKLPDIWYDIMLSSDFENCFMESLLIELNKSKSKNKFASFIKNKLSLKLEQIDLKDIVRIIQQDNFSEELLNFQTNRNRETKK